MIKKNLKSIYIFTINVFILIDKLSIQKHSSEKYFPLYTYVRQSTPTIDLFTRTIHSFCTVNTLTTTLSCILKIRDSKQSAIGATTRVIHICQFAVLVQCSIIYRTHFEFVFVIWIEFEL